MTEQAKMTHVLNIHLWWDPSDPRLPWVAQTYLPPSEKTEERSSDPATAVHSVVQAAERAALLQAAGDAGE